MIYDPGPFLISTAALTSILSFFFGNYFRYREKIYSQWIAYIAYDSEVVKTDAKKGLCADLESKERVYSQLKNLMMVLLLTIIVDYLAFQFYSLAYIIPESAHFEDGAWHIYIWYNTIISIIVLINCLEILYLQIAVVFQGFLSVCEFA
ncbi:MAG: hypothetical protein U5J62_04150 [Desulfurivibrio sp.]|nr:hypothetical protein [Desulfurivibrio sp.]